MKSARDPREDRSLEGADTGAHAGGDYLWDKTGRDAEVEQLESLLGGFRHAGAPLEPRRRPSYYPPPIWGAVTAIAAVLVAILMIVVRSGGTKTSLPLDAYAVLHDAGGKDAPSVLRSGDELVFASRARVQIGALGEVEVEPDSRLRVERIEERRHRLYLAEGRVRATIDAEPRVFQIGTPAGDAVDLGCAYELTVDEDGSAEVRVTEGEVSFELDGREVYVPAGASCRSTPGDGPRAPFFDAVDAAGFSSAVPGVLHYDMTRDDPRMTEMLETLMEREDVVGLVDGGVANNVPGLMQGDL